MADFGDYYGGGNVPVMNGSAPVIAPQGAGGPAVRANFSVGGGVGTSGLGTLAGLGVLLLVTFWLLHNG